MDFLNNLKLKSKLLLGFSVIIVLLCAISGIAIYSLNSGTSTAERVEYIFQERYVKISTAARLISDSNNALAIYLSPGAQTEANRADVEKNLTELDSLLQTMQREGYKGIEPVVQGVQNYHQAYENIILDLVQKNMPFDALAYYMTNMLPESQRLAGLQYAVIDDLIKEISASVAALSNNSYMFLVGIVTLLSIIVAYVIAQLNTGYVVKRLKVNHNLASSIAHSDLTVDVDTSGRDEFGDLSRTMDSMKKDLNQSMLGIVNFANQLQSKLNQVKTMSSNVVQDAQNVESQAVSVAASSNEMAATTTNIAQTCETAAQISQQSLDITQNGVDSIRSAINDIRHQSQRTQDDAAKIKALTSQINKISDIVNTINDIAAQTNLLALNAAIEAARAGEAGRGFAVVADEVRALSQRTSASTQVISETVTNIQTEARQAEESMQMSVDNMDAVANRTASIEGLLNDITSHVSQVNEHITHIVSSIEQQSISTGEVSNNMQIISTSIQDVSNESSKSNDIIEESMQALNDLLNNLAQFKLAK